MVKVLPGELVIVEYVNGAFVNRWGLVTAKGGVEAGDGRKAANGYVDLLHEGKAGSKIIDNRINVTTADAQGIMFLSDLGFRTQDFNGKTLAVLKLVNEVDRFNSAGTKIGTLPAGVEIGIETGSAGNSNRHLMSVNAYNDGSGWKFINEQTYTYGFINVQLGFGLKMYNSVRSLETVKSTVKEPTIDWTGISTILVNGSIEQELRNIQPTDTRDAIVQDVNDYFAVTDLKAATLGDGSLFFGSDKNSDFVSRALVINGQSANKAKFETEKANFRALFS
jgi:hypothetical protein